MKPCHDLPIVGNGKAGALVDRLCQAQGETLRMEALQAGTSPWPGVAVVIFF